MRLMNRAGRREQAKVAQANNEETDTTSEYIYSID
jgi:hypothetical protein